MDTNIKQHKVTEVVPRDRLDLISYRHLGNPYSYNKILKLNPHIDIWNLISGSIIKLPND